MVADRPDGDLAEVAQNLPGQDQVGVAADLPDRVEAAL
jgi:hypothetical protein